MKVLKHTFKIIYETPRIFKYSWRNSNKNKKWWSVDKKKFLKLDSFGRGRTLIRINQDPMDQSFLVDSVGGEFITKVDLFFSQVKLDGVINHSNDKRNGWWIFYRKNVIKWISKTLEPEDVNVSEDGFGW